ncbi:uncharacterized protein LOC111990186 [Quercus suber]|uniref:J domain-containing protein n=1 Tax=Quercus suber TaxID=58331 RepID=A0AAW0KDD8_QUESU|nr:uncharacterized protein LOC111990186 [Quercus suber]POE79210.1 hypothetical protein CFP56_31341 [Quercus suber]
MPDMNENRVKALLEQQNAEQKIISSNDYTGARFNLLKAQQLFPAIDNISSMMDVCDVLSASNMTVPGYGIDYYWVLQLPPYSTMDAVKSRYQWLFTLLQPIKKTFPGTELALKLVADAFSILSDHEKRSAYDLKRKAFWGGNQSFNKRELSCQNIASTEAMINAQNSSVCQSGFSSQSLGGSCRKTMIFSEDVGTLGFKLQNSLDVEQQHDRIICQQSSIKVSEDLNFRGNIRGDTGLSIDDINLSTSQPISLEENFSCSSKPLAQKRPCQDYYNFENDRKPEHFKVGQIWGAQHRANLPHTFRYAQVACKLARSVLVTWLKPIPISVGERRWCDAGLPVACGSFDLNPEMNDGESWPMVSSYKCSWIRGITDEQFEIFPKRGEIWALYKDWNLHEWAYDLSFVKGCKFELVEILSDFSKYLGADGACLVKVDGFRSIFERQKIGGSAVTFHISPDNLYIFSHNIPAYRFKGGEIDKVVDGMFELDQLALPDSMFQEIIDSQKAPKNGNASSFPSSIPLGGLPSPKSSPQDKLLKPSWSLNDFAIGQVWAVNSGKDFLPRQYTRIDDIISESQVCVTFLEPLPILDHEIDWKKENLPIVRGKFKVSGASVNLEMSQFSYNVNYQKSTVEPIYEIYPLKGEIWAMYKNWNSRWKRSDYENYQCQVVEILSHLHERDEITIARLEEVKGCLTFYHRLQIDGFDVTHSVSQSKMLGFSHRILAFRVPGIGKYDIPESSWHLEPNALPPKRRI